MISCTGTAGASVVMWEDTSCRGAPVFAGSAGGADGVTVPAGGGGKGPCRWAAIGSANATVAAIKSIPTLFFRSLRVTPDMTSLILSGLLTLLSLYCT